MKLSIVIPAYNEENRITKSLEKIINFKNENNFVEEIIVVNDGSKDRTIEEVKKFEEIKFITYEKNRGKGYALKTGIQNAKGDWIYICDSDLSTPIDELHKFIKYTGTYDCIIGSRAKKGAREKSSFFRKIMGKMGNKLVKLLLGLSINDTQCGFKLFNKNAANIFLEGKIDGWGFDFEFLYLLNKKGFKIFELPVKWVDAEGSKFVASEYKKMMRDLFTVFWMYKKYSLFRLIKYLIVGTLTNGLNILFFIIATKLINPFSFNISGFEILSYQIIDTLNYFLTIVFLNFILHKYWTFESDGWDFREIIRYTFVLIANYLAGIIMLTVFIEGFGLKHWVSKLISTGFIAFWNFFLLKLFVYKDSEKLL